MHRAFVPDPLPREQLERVAGVIRRAPSGGFAQGMSIVVVTDDERRRVIAARFELADGFMADAPAHLVICANESLYHARYNEPDKLAATGGVEVTWPVPYWFVDAGALMMLVLLAAIDEGLASAFVGHPNRSGSSTSCWDCPRRSSRSASPSSGSPATTRRPGHEWPTGA